MTSVAFTTKSLILALGCLLLSDTREWKWDFSKDPVGSQPAGFEFKKFGDGPPGKWEIVDDEGNRCLAQLDENPADHRYLHAIDEDSKIEDVKLSVRIKAVRGENDQSGGVVWRYRDNKNFLVARLDVTEKNVRLFRFCDGNRVNLGQEGDLDLKTGEWYTLRVEHRGPKIKVYLDDDVLIMRHDKHFQQPGRIGMWTKSHSVMYFDDLAVKDLDDDDDDD